MLSLAALALFCLAPRGHCDSTKPTPAPQAKLPQPTENKVQGDELSPDGKWWIVYNANRSLGVISVDGKSSLKIPLIRDASGIWSNDSKTIYLERESSKPDVTSIEALDLATGVISVLKAPEDKVLLNLMAPSPTGRYVAITAEDMKSRQPGSQVELLETGTSRARTLPGLSALAFLSGHWSSDEKRITFIGHDNANGKSGLITVTLTEPATATVSPLQVAYFRYSPSGNEVAYLGVKDTKQHFNVLSVADSNNKIVLAVTRNGFMPNFLWSDDGRYLYASDIVFNKGFSILKIEVKTGKCVDLVPFGKPVIQLTAIHGDTLYYRLLIPTDSVGDAKSKSMEIRVGQ